MYEVFEHTADLGLRVRAERLDELFAEAGRALFSLLATNLEAVRETQERTFEILPTQDADLEYLLFDWLNELLYVYETERLLLSRFETTVDADGTLRATGRGERLDRKRHDMHHEVKAITYHELKVENGPSGWLAEVIVDI